MGRLKQGLAVADLAARKLGRLMGAGKSARTQADSVRRVAKGTGAFQDPYLRAGVKPYIEEIVKLKGKQKAAERVVGYGLPAFLVGGGSTVGHLLSRDSKGDKPAEVVESKPATPAAAAAAPTDKADKVKKQAEPKDTTLRNIGMYGGAAAVGATLGGIIDRRDRLRGVLLGGLIAPTAVALGDYLYQTNTNNA